MSFPRNAPSEHSFKPQSNQGTMGGVFSEGKLAPTDPPLTAETCLQTFHLLADQLTVYTDGSATAETKAGNAGVIVTNGDPAEQGSTRRSPRRVRKKRRPRTRIKTGHRYPHRALTHTLHRHLGSTMPDICCLVKPMSLPLSCSAEVKHFQLTREASRQTAYHAWLCSEIIRCFHLF